MQRSWLRKRCYDSGITYEKIGEILGVSKQAASQMVARGKIPRKHLLKFSTLLKTPIEVVAASSGYLPYSVKCWIVDHPYEWYDALKQLERHGYFKLEEEDFIWPAKPTRKKIKLKLSNVFGG